MISYLIVLQKLLEVRKADWERVFLCNHSSGLIEEENLLFGVLHSFDTVGETLLNV